MNLFDRVKSFHERMEWYDYSIIKLATFLFTMFLFGAWPAFREFVMSIHWGWFLGVSLVVAMPIFKKF
jgi:hypothetical protein